MKIQKIPAAQILREINFDEFVRKLAKLISLKKRYRPGQPNWEYPTWKFQDFSVTQILREINFGHFEASKTAFFSSSEF